MPENATQRLGPRSPLPPAQTGFEIAQVPKERPTDPYSATAAASPASDLMQSLGILSNTVVPVVIKAGEQWAKEEKKKGAQSRMVGDAIAPSQSNAFIDGFERMDGTYRGIQFGNAAKEYAVKNSHLDPTEFQKGLDALQAEYVGKLIHQGQVDTFLPDALRAGEQATAIYQESKNAAIVQERNQKVEDIYQGQISTLLDKHAAEILGIPLAKGFSSIATDPEMRARYDANKEAFRVAVAPGFHGIVEGAVSNYKSLGMTPRDLREKFVGRVGRLAGDVGAEDLLDVAYQKDASGMSAETSDPKAVNAFADRARATGEHISNAMILRADKALKLETEKKVGDWLMDLSNPAVTVATAEKIWVDVWNNKDLDANAKEKLANHAADVMLGMGFAQKDNQVVARDLEDKIMGGKLSGRAAHDAVLAASHRLSPSTYRHFLEKIESINNRKGDTKKERGWAMFQRESGDYKTALIRTLGLQDEEGKIMIGLENDSKALIALSKVTTDAVGAWYRGIEKLAAANGDLEDNIPGADLKTLYDRIITVHRPRTDFIAKTAKNPVDKPGQITTPEQTPEQRKDTPPSTKTGKVSDLVKGIKKGWTPTGQFSGGKQIYLSPDGKTESTGD